MARDHVISSASDDEEEAEEADWPVEPFLDGLG
jgi:hypothetical protein